MISPVLNILKHYSVHSGQGPLSSVLQNVVRNRLQAPRPHTDKDTKVVTVSNSKNKYIKDRKGTVGQIFKKEARFTSKGFSQNYTGHVTKRPVLAEHLIVKPRTDTMTSYFNLVDNHTVVKAKWEIDKLLTRVRSSLVVSRYQVKKKGTQLLNLHIQHFLRDLQLTLDEKDPVHL